MKKNFIFSLFLYFVFFSIPFANAAVYDDVKIGDLPIEIEDYGIIELKNFTMDGRRSMDGYGFYTIDGYDFYAILKISIINTMQEGYDFAKDISIKVFYNRKNKGYQFSGTVSHKSIIPPLEEGVYVCSCKITRYIYEDKKSPLMMAIKFGDNNELIYNINPRE